MKSVVAGKSLTQQSMFYILVRKILLSHTSFSFSLCPRAKFLWSSLYRKKLLWINLFSAYLTFEYSYLEWFKKQKLYNAMLILASDTVKLY